MIAVELELPDFKEFLQELEDPEAARDFLLHCVGLGYSIKELGEGEDIRDLHDHQAVELSKHYWAVFFLTEYPDYGDYEQ